MKAGPNPYEPPEVGGEPRPHSGENSKLVRAGFLYRRIELTQPISAVFIYNGWNFLQRISFNDIVVWKRISWVTIHRKAEFQLPEAIDPMGRTGSISIEFNRALWIRRFQLTIGDELVYSESGHV